jgi:hypothetical protein
MLCSGFYAAVLGCCTRNYYVIAALGASLGRNEAGQPESRQQNGETPLAQGAALPFRCFSLAIVPHEMNSPMN